MYYITNTMENAGSKHFLEFNTNTFTLDTLVLYCAVWMRKDNDGTTYFLREDGSDEERIYPVHRTIYVNGRRASLKDLNKLYYRQVRGSVDVVMHRTGEGSIAFDTDD